MLNCAIPSDILIFMCAFLYCAIWCMSLLVLFESLIIFSSHCQVEYLKSIPMILFLYSSGQSMLYVCYECAIYICFRKFLFFLAIWVPLAESSFCILSVLFRIKRSFCHVRNDGKIHRMYINIILQRQDLFLHDFTRSLEFLLRYLLGTAVQALVVSGVS